MICKFKRLSSFLISTVIAVVFVLSGAVSVPDTVSADAVSDMDSVVKSYSRFCAVKVCTMEGEELYSYNADSSVFCASLIKLPYAVYVCHEITAGRKTLDDTFTYTSSWYHGGSGVIKNNGYGVKYTIRQLLDYMLRYSDNVAYDALVYLFGTDGFNSMVREWGYSVTLGTPSPRWPNITAEFMHDSMKQMALHSSDGEPWAVAWDALCNSEDVIVRSVLGNDDTDVAIKYGLVEYVYHEVSYVGCEEPYILIILTGISGYNINSSFVKKVAGCADGIVKEYIARKPKPGDVNGDGQINAEDMVFLWSHLMGRENTSLPKPENADVSGDGNVNILDYVVLMNTIVEE